MAGGRLRGDAVVWAKLAAMATAFGQTAVRRDGAVPDRLTRTWIATQSHLPEGWTLYGLRCSSTEVTVEARTDEWVAIAIGPSGEERTCHAIDAVSALQGLAESFDR